MADLQDFIEFKKVTFSYTQDRMILDCADLSVDRSNFTAVMGPNGCGKTTLGKLLVGILKPDSGEIILDGRDVSGMNLAQIGSIAGYLFQNPEVQIFANTVIDELSFVMKIKGIEESIIDKKVSEVLELLNLSAHKNSGTFSLSYGEKQRLALAGILINDPQFLILDEPTTGLDIERKTILVEILKNLIKAGKGMMVMSHDEKFINNFSGTILKISNGKITKEIL